MERKKITAHADVNKEELFACGLSHVMLGLDIKVTSNVRAVTEMLQGMGKQEVLEGAVHL